MEDNLNKSEPEKIIYPDEEEANKDLFQGEPWVDFDPFEDAILAYKSPDRFFDEEGYAHYYFTKDGVEYSCKLFERYKGLVSYSLGEKEDFLSVYVGACKRGSEVNFIPFPEPVKENPENYDAYHKALALAREILIHEEDGPKPRSLTKN